MTVDIDLLPREPATQWQKPTLANTKGGKLYKPTHPGLLQVVFSPANTRPVTAQKGETGQEVDEEAFSSRLIAVRDFAPNSIITPLSNLSRAPEKAYSSVQYGPSAHEHLELNSDLLFMNHSCAPSAFVVLPAQRVAEWVVRAGPRGIKAGEDVTFFYPSTEWDMAQGFDCSCASASCLGRIQGARHLSLSELEQRGYVNEHIRTLKAVEGKAD